jgi:hypothetical protein
LRTDLVVDRHHTACLLGGGPGIGRPEPCDTAPVATVSWTLHQRERLVASSGPESARGVDDGVSISGGQAAKDLGSVDLRGGRDYVLAMKVSQAEPVLSNASVEVALHPWEVKDGLGTMLIGLVLTVLLGIAGLMGLVPELGPIHIQDSLG